MFQIIHIISNGICFAVDFAETVNWIFKQIVHSQQLKHRTACFVHLSFQIATQKNEAKMSSFVQLDNKMASYSAL